MEIKTGGVFTGERALFMSRDLEVRDSVFEDGESPLKESKNLILDGCTFKWKYPVWYCDKVLMKNCKLDTTARSGIWYTTNLTVEDCEIDAPKTFRRAKNISLNNVNLNNAEETMWGCSFVRLNNVYVKGDYFLMNGNTIEANNLVIDGNYCFDGAKNIVIRNSKLKSKDSFWNCENVTVYDSEIIGEYIGWNSENVKFVNCHIESDQGFCYMNNLIMENCTLANTDLAFEYSKINADIHSHIDSVKNIKAGKLVADSIGELIMEEDKVDVCKTTVEVRKNV